MFTSLDLLVIVFAAFAAITLFALALMFLIKNKTAKRVCFYVTSALGLYISWVGFRIGLGGWFPIMMAVGILTALACIGAFILERASRGNNKMFFIARILSASALVIGFFNAIL